MDQARLPDEADLVTSVSVSCTVMQAGVASLAHGSGLQHAAAEEQTAV
jgi:hypothetical protein